MVGQKENLEDQKRRRMKHKNNSKSEEIYFYQDMYKYKLNKYQSVEADLQDKSLKLFLLQVQMIMLVQL